MIAKFLPRTGVANFVNKFGFDCCSVNKYGGHHIVLRFHWQEIPRIILYAKSYTTECKLTGILIVINDKIICNKVYDIKEESLRLAIGCARRSLSIIELLSYTIPVSIIFLFLAFIIDCLCLATFRRRSPTHPPLPEIYNGAKPNITL